MSAISGRNGVLKMVLPSVSGADDAAVGGTKVILANLKSWTIDTAADSLDTTAMGTAGNYRTFVSGLKTWSVSADFLYDDAAEVTVGADGNQFAAGEIVYLFIYPDDDAASSTVWSGKATVESLSVTAAFDGLVEASASFASRGALSKTVD
jgi:TP901-1 family phage major tail protein